jgi:hypothetical protein
MVCLQTLNCSALPEAYEYTIHCNSLRYTRRAADKVSLNYLSNDKEEELITLRNLVFCSIASSHRFQFPKQTRSETCNFFNKLPNLCVDATCSTTPSVVLRKVAVAMQFV